MKSNVFYRRLAAGFAVALSALMLEVVPVAADVFTIDTNQSSLTITGSVSGATFVQQGTGSMSTKYGGTIQLSQTAGTIQFTGLSLITAFNSGSWQPLAGGGAGIAPANYGAAASLFSGFVTAVAALRSIVLDVTSPQIAVTGGQFNPGGLTFSFPASSTSALDYKASGLISDADAITLTGNSTNSVATNAILTTVGNEQTLTLGVNVTFHFSVFDTNDTIINLSGHIVATHTTSAPLVVLTPAVTNHVVTLKWQSPAGQFYQVLSSSNLLTWQTNASNITSASTDYSWITTNPASKGFYLLSH